MPRKIKKQEAIEILKSLDALDIQYQIIFRAASESKKREFQRALNTLIESYIREDRDVVVLAVKVK
jgi:hypothetical protein